MTTRLPGIRAIAIVTSAALAFALVLATAPAAPAAATPRALLVKPGAGTKGERSVRVRAVQRALQRHGFRVHRADGRFGRATRLAVRRFQRRAGLRVDGVVGTRTRQALGLTASFTRVHVRRVRARQVAAHRRTVANRRAAALADRRRARATPAPRKAVPDPAPIVAPAVHAAGTSGAPAANPRPVASARHGLPGGPDLTAALASLIVIATWLLVRQAPPRPGRPALALGGGAVAPLVDAPAGGLRGTGVASDHLSGREAYGPRGAGGAAAPGHEEASRARGAAPFEGEGSAGRGAAGTARQATPRADGSRRSTRSDAGAVSGGARHRAPAPARPLGAGTPVIAYIDTSAGVGGRAAKKIEQTCARAGWELIEVVAERGDRRAPERAGLAYAVERIEKGEADALVIRDLADLGRRGTGRATLTRRVRNAGAALVTCVPGATPVIEQRSERPGRGGRDGSPRRGAHDLRRRIPGATSGGSPLRRGRGAS